MGGKALFWFGAWRRSFLTLHLLITAVNLLGRVALIGAAAAGSVAIVSSISTVVLVAPMGVLSSLVKASLVVAAGLAALGTLIMMGTWRLDYRRPVNQLTLNATGTFEAKNVAAEVRALRASLTEQELAAAVKAMLDMRRFTRRTTEVVEFRDATLGRTLTRTIEIPVGYVPAQMKKRKHRHQNDGGNATFTWWVPVHRHRKGSLIDQLSLTVDDTATHTMPHNRNIALSLLVVDWCLGKVLRPLGRDARAQVSAFGGGILEAVANPMASSKSSEFVESVSGLSDFLEGVSPDLLKSSSWQRLLRVATYLADYYVIVAPVPVTNSARGGGRQVSVTASTVEPRRDVQSGISSGARRLLGIPIYRYKVVIPGAIETDTYHLRATAPAGTYLYSANVCHSETANRPARRGQRMPPRPRTAVSVVSPTYGSESVHVYCRALGQFIRPYTVSDPGGRRSARPEGLYADIEFRPTPPGLSGPVTFLALYLAAITTGVALFHDRFFGGFVATSSAVAISGTPAPVGGVQTAMNGGASTGVALILALPTILAGWLVSRLDSAGLRTVTPTLVMEFAGLVFASLFAVGVTVAKLGQDPMQRGAQEEFPAFLEPWLTGHAWWAAVWVLSVTLALLTLLGFLTRYARYRRTLRRRA